MTLRPHVEVAVLLGATLCPGCRGEGTVPLEMPFERVQDAYGATHVTTMHDRSICDTCKGHGTIERVCPECQCCTFLPPDARGFSRCAGCGYPGQ